MNSPKKTMLWSGTAPFSEDGDGFQPYMESFLLKTPTPAGAVIVLPGGGYAGKMISYEGRDVCTRFNKEGFHSFMLEYRVAPNRYPAPLVDVAEAVRTVRRNAAKWKIKPDKIAVLGFSAGGHLAASACVHYGLAESLISDKKSNSGYHPAGHALDGITCYLQENVSARPDAGILCYPVISSGKFGHAGSFKNLLGENPSDELIKKMSLEFNVHQNAPPVFLWHTANDGGVPVENSLLFAEALSLHKVPFELHIYPDGPHGMGMGGDDPHVATWVDLCVEWLRKMSF
ncbi:MAG: alpha/beta hydrolase [Lentisphaerae bacterium]|nr:alpha/beta hydrolase [Lentisphaerota bacterium]